jgi:hypothetical protein
MRHLHLHLNLHAAAALASITMATIFVPMRMRLRRRLLGASASNINPSSTLEYGGGGWRRPPCHAHAFGLDANKNNERDGDVGEAVPNADAANWVR